MYLRNRYTIFLQNSGKKNSEIVTVFILRKLNNNLRKCSVPVAISLILARLLSISTQRLGSLCKEGHICRNQAYQLIGIIYMHPNMFTVQNHICK
jgi:hypothetical protein